MISVLCANENKRPKTAGTPGFCENEGPKAAWSLTSVFMEPKINCHKTATIYDLCVYASKNKYPQTGRILDFFLICKRNKWPKTAGIPDFMQEKPT